MTAPSITASGARVTIQLPGTPYQHRGLPYAAKGRLSIALGRGTFSHLARHVGMAEPYLGGSIALGFQPYATLRRSSYDTDS
jgi:hypothetical protein